MKRAKFLGNLGMIGTLVGILSLIQERSMVGFMLLCVSAFLLISSNVMLSKLYKEAGKESEKSN